MLGQALVHGRVLPDPLRKAVGHCSVAHRVAKRIHATIFAHLGLRGRVNRLRSGRHAVLLRLPLDSHVDHVVLGPRDKPHGFLHQRVTLCGAVCWHEALALRPHVVEVLRGHVQQLPEALHHRLARLRGRGHLLLGEVPHPAGRILRLDARPEASRLGAQGVVRRAVGGRAGLGALGLALAVQLRLDRGHTGAGLESGKPVRVLFEARLLQPSDGAVAQVTLGRIHAAGAQLEVLGLGLEIRVQHLREAGLGALRLAEAEEHVLHLLEAGQPGEPLVRLGVLHDALRQDPLHCAVALLAFDGCVADVAGLRAVDGGVRVAVEVHLHLRPL
mmetsp:Transcript_50609/g.134911  ORF Transcript_50609/g.134911 Transcript_50609/m.134911 type:complete len:330 (+) Transcript_50609:748-1737(+)